MKFDAWMPSSSLRVSTTIRSGAFSGSRPGMSDRINRQSSAPHHSAEARHVQIGCVSKLWRRSLTHSSNASNSSFDAF